MNLVTVRDIYKNRENYLNKEIEVGGWVRSIRDSKAFGFLVLADGSYFETLQIVFHDNMDNFDEICKCNVGAAVIVKGTLIPTPEAKQPFEIQAVSVAVEGPSAPSAEETSQLRVPAYHFPSASKNQHLPGSIPCPFPDRICHSSVFPGERLCLRPHSTDHLQ